MAEGRLPGAPLVLEGQSADIPATWEATLADLVRRPPRRTLVLGASDRGKSTFCRLLLRRLHAAGAPAALVDADIGQKDLGPPASIALGVLDPGSAPAVYPQAAYFVGTVSPGGQFLPLIVGTRNLAEATARPTVINTPGTIQGPGRILQSFQLESLRPDAVVVLQRGEEAAALRVAAAGRRVHPLPPSPAARSRSPGERRRNRERAFRAYFREARRIDLPLAALVFRRCLLFSGRPRAPGAHLHAEDTAEGRLVVGGPRPGRAGAGWLPAGFERDLLCGVDNRAPEALGMARLQAIDFARGRITLLTPVPPESVAGLTLGALYVAGDGRELPHRRPRAL